MTEVTMPRLSDSMEEGTIVRWLVSDGAAVARGDELAEIETDKATMTYEADAAGAVHLVAAEGDALPVGAVIAHLLGEGEEAPALAGVATTAPAPAAPAANGGRVKASPLARRLARELGVDLAPLSGTGSGGRIVRADVERAAASAATPEPPRTTGPAAPANAGKGDIETVELTSTQKVIARRMAESKATIPDFQVRMEADVTDLLALRAQLKAAGRTASVNDFVVKACAIALREHPRANGAYKDGTFELHRRVNVGVAVAGEGTLVVPTIFDADAKPVTQIARETRALAGKVREGTITPPELSGGTFTVSNLGMFGVTSFTAVINPGQAAILAVGAAVERPAFRDGALIARSSMDLSLSCDHRILYGADGAAFLGRVRALLERPFALLA